MTAQDTKSHEENEPVSASAQDTKESVATNEGGIKLRPNVHFYPAPQPKHTDISDFTSGNTYSPAVNFEEDNNRYVYNDWSTCIVVYCNFIFVSLQISSPFRISSKLPLFVHTGFNTYNITRTLCSIEVIHVFRIK